MIFRISLQSFIVKSEAVMFPTLLKASCEPSLSEHSFRGLLARLGVSEGRVQIAVQPDSLEEAEGMWEQLSPPPSIIN